MASIPKIPLTAKFVRFAFDSISAVLLLDVQKESQEEHEKTYCWFGVNVLLASQLAQPFSKSYCRRH